MVSIVELRHAPRIVARLCKILELTSLDEVGNAGRLAEDGDPIDGVICRAGIEDHNGFDMGKNRMKAPLDARTFILDDHIQTQRWLHKDFLSWGSGGPEVSRTDLRKRF